MNNYFKNNIILIERKLYQITGQIIKKFKDSVGTSVLINSFPKSGTHLLYQLFENSSYLTEYDTFIVSMPSFIQMERSQKKTRKMINSIVDGELVRAHLFYDSAYEELLVKKKVIHFFIYRDPRDVAISEANYLYDMNPFNRFHHYFVKFPHLNDRIMFSIKGNGFYQTPIDYPNIVKRFEKYKEWLSSKHVYSIKYEDFVGKNRDEKIRKLMKHYANHSNEKMDVNQLVETAISNIDPQKSHTFREGCIQKWKKYFNKENKNVFKEICGDLLIELGYESDYNW